MRDKKVIEKCVDHASKSVRVNKVEIMHNPNTLVVLEKKNRNCFVVQNQMNKCPE